MFSPPGFSSSPPSSTLEFQLPSEQFQLTDQVCHMYFGLEQVSRVLCYVTGVSRVLCIISGVSRVLCFVLGVSRVLCII